MFEKKYDIAFEEIKRMYHAFDHENASIIEYTKWIEASEHFRENAQCSESEKKADKENSTHACMDRFIMINVIEMCAYDIYLIRSYKKGLKQDWIGSINDLEIAFKYALSDQQKSKVFFMKGISFLSLDKKDEGCLNLSKAGELGYEEAYAIIQQHCN